MFTFDTVHLKILFSCLEFTLFYFFRIFRVFFIDIRLNIHTQTHTPTSTRTHIIYSIVCFFSSSFSNVLLFSHSMCSLLRSAPYTFDIRATKSHFRYWNFSFRYIAFCWHINMRWQHHKRLNNTATKKRSTQYPTIDFVRILSANFFCSYPCVIFSICLFWLSIYFCWKGIQRNSNKRILIHFV